MRITILGEAKVRWIKAVMTGSGGGVLPYHGDEAYFKQEFFPEGGKSTCGIYPASKDTLAQRWTNVVQGWPDVR